MKIKKAVIPIAGKGTRFLPATKEMPKEMIPIINFPMIHYVVQEAVASEIEQIIFVTSSGKSVIESYFDRNYALEAFLKDNGKEHEYEWIKSIGEMVDVVTVRQKQQLGLGHAISCAESVVGKDDFVVILGDDLILGPIPVAQQLIEIYYQLGKSVIGVMEVDPQETSRYGIVDGNYDIGNKKLLKMTRMVEKPSPKDAPTNLATPGRYVLTSEIFPCLKAISRGAGGEYQLTDGINMLAQKQAVYAYLFSGDRFDTGNIEGHLNATVEFALRDSQTRPIMEKIIKEKIKKYGIIH